MRFEKRLLFAFVIGLVFCLSGCNGKKDAEITADMISNPATPDGIDYNAAMPILTFVETEHDFGTLKEGEKVTYSYAFTNTGKTNLIISSVIPGCGCTVADFTRTPVAPQKSGKVTITFDSKDRVGMVRKRISVQSNTYPAETVLYFTANVEKP